MSAIGSDYAIMMDRVSKRYRVARRPRLRLAGTFASPSSVRDMDELEELGTEFDEKDEESPEEVHSRRPTEIWALREVSLMVRTGVRFAVVGPHGGGKTTLLRVLGRTTALTGGRVALRGPVAPTADTVGRLFEPELSAIENVELVSALYDVPGDVGRIRTDAILDFAALRSHGMVELYRLPESYRRRLASAIPVHLNARVLLADELPAMSDSDYRERYVQRLEELTAGGATLVLATKDLRIAERLCMEAAWLEEGRLLASGVASGVAGLYRETRKGSAPTPVSGTPRVQPTLLRENGYVVEILGATAHADDGEQVEAATRKDPLRVEVLIEVNRPARLICKVSLRNKRAGRLALRHQTPLEAPAPGTYVARVELPVGSLPRGVYRGRATVAVEPGGGPTLKSDRFSVRVFDPPEGSPAKEPSGGVASLTLPWTIGRVASDTDG